MLNHFSKKIAINQLRNTFVNLASTIFDAYTPTDTHTHIFFFTRSPFVCLTLLSTPLCERLEGKVSRYLKPTTELLIALPTWPLRDSSWPSFFLDVSIRLSAWA